MLDQGSASPWARFEADSLTRPPDAFTMAFQADERWMSEIDLVHRNPFALIYFTLFVGPSFLTHPSVSGVARVVVGTPPNLILGMPEPLGVSEMPYGQSLLTFANVLLVASRSLGWPEEGQIRAALNRA